MRILAAVDLSEHSQCVLEAIQERAWEADTEIKLTTVIEQNYDPVRYQGGYHRIEYKQLTDDPSYPHKRLSFLSNSLRKLIGKRNFNVSIDPVIKIGHPVDEIIHLVKLWNPDLIVVGTHEKVGLENLLLGSVSRSILHHAMANVHIAKSVSSPNNKVYRILVPVDESTFSQAAIDWLLKQRWRKPLEINLLTAIPEIHQLTERYSEEANTEQAAIMLGDIQLRKAESISTLESRVDEVQRRTKAVSVLCTAVVGVPEDVINKTALEWQADLVVMGSHGRSGLSRMLLGSVSSAVAQKSPSSVEVVKTRALHDWYGQGRQDA